VSRVNPLRHRLASLRLDLSILLDIYVVIALQRLDMARRVLHCEARDEAKGVDDGASSTCSLLLRSKAG
jgi:hypothetical protein